MKLKTVRDADKDIESEVSTFDSLGFDVNLTRTYLRICTS